ncbi:MAG: L,D-transpeptidase family protein [Deltaproteobacteria bacterium]|nr:L,D-transpeptidase family protein [Deltaproteobacteria bacterium]
MKRLGMFLLLVACATGDRRGPPPRDLDVDTQPHAVAPEPTGQAAGSGVAPVAGSQPAVTPQPAPALPQAGPPDPATLTRLAWPAATTSFVLRSSAHVYASPDLSSEPLGKIIIGTRLPVGESLDGDKRCKTWLAAAPRGWVCARYVKPSTLPPEAVVQPEVPDGKLLPQDYYGIKKGGKRYATEDDVRAGIARPEPKIESTYMVTKDKEKTKDKTVEIDGERYVYTSVGLVAASDLYKHWPSTFAGVDLVKTPPPAWPFAWVIAANRKTVTARATADKKGVEAGTLAHREIVPVLEEAPGFVRVADGRWVERGSLRIARKRPRPAVDAAHPKWIDLDRDEQVMIAYDGETPVFATLISSGRRKKDTPPALYRIRSKTAITKMAAEEREDSHYEVSEVPWATRFRSGLYFHAAYWHDQFGTAKSHGCVNLSPRDAKWVYDWTEPTMPVGWNELEVAVPQSMVVRVHDAKQPDPPVFDYEREAKQRVKIRKKEKELKEKREAAEAAAAEAAAAEAAGTVPPLPPP